MQCFKLKLANYSLFSWGKKKKRRNNVFLLHFSGDPILKGNERSKQGSNQESWKARVLIKMGIQQCDLLK